MKITKRKDGRYQCNVYLGTDPISGKRIQKTVSAKTKSECRAKVNAIMADPEQITDTTQTLSFSVWCDTWLNEYCNSYAPSTWKAAQSHIENHIRPYFGKRIALKDVTPVLCQKFINSISETKSPKTVRNISGTLHKILSTAVKIGYIKTNPADRLDIPKRTAPKIRPMDEDEIRRFLSVQDPYSLCFRLTLYTGLRISEVLGLTWDRIDFDHKLITIDRQLNRSGDGFAPTKHGRIRHVPLNANAEETLRRIRMEQNETRLRNAPYFENTLGLVITGEIGSPVSRSTIEKHFKSAVRSIGLPDTRFHDLRHTFAVLNLRAGVDPKTISESLGHYSVAFTLDTYAFVTAQMQNEAVQKLDSFLADF